MLGEKSSKCIYYISIYSRDVDCLILTIIITHVYCTHGCLLISEGLNDKAFTRTEKKITKHKASMNTTDRAE